MNFAAFDVKNAETVRRRRATANRVLTYLKAALNHAWRAGLVPSDEAWRRVKPFKPVDAPVIRYLSHDEITRLLNVCQRAFRDLLHTPSREVLLHHPGHIGVATGDPHGANRVRERRRPGRRRLRETVGTPA
jgi:hypothetical protein